MADKRNTSHATEGPGLPLGVKYLPRYFDLTEQEALLEAIRAVIAEAPLYTPEMPRTGRPMSVAMTNCGRLGWVTDKAGGYRYQPVHPTSGAAWPQLPAVLADLWRDVADYPAPPEACLVNWYHAKAKMGLHQDRDEKDFDAPVVSVSLGDDAVFSIGALSRKDAVVRLTLRSGDVVVLGGAARLAFHGIDRLLSGTSTLLAEGGRLNLTLRRVTRN